MNEWMDKFISCYLKGDCMTWNIDIFGVTMINMSFTFSWILFYVNKSDWKDNQNKSAVLFSNLVNLYHIVILKWDQMFII